MDLFQTQGQATVAIGGIDYGDSNGFVHLRQAGEIELPQQVTGMINVAKVAAGGNFSLILKSDGTVWVSGDNSFGQTATDLGDASNSSVFIQVPGLTSITDVAAGSGHCLALAADGSVWSWGANTHGQTGLGSTEIAITVPQKIAGLANITQIAAGNNFSLALSSSGNIYGFGDNAYLQLADSNTAPKNVPAQLSSLSSIGYISCGNSHSVAFDANSAYLWGKNNAGQLGNGLTTNLAVPTDSSITW